MHLASKELSNTIDADSTSTDAQKAKALIFLCLHLQRDLKNEYLTEKDRQVLWTSLKDRFDQQKSIVLPQAQFDWVNLRFQDYKTVIDYNSALHKIVSQLKFCKQEISETDMIEKTLSTFHASNLVLQQQYRTKNYTKHSELISALLVAEKHELLMRNHNARPVGSAPVPEAHNNIAQSSNSRRARGMGRGRDRGRGSQRGGRNECNNIQNRKQNDQTQRGQPSSSNHNSGQKQVCYRCGCEGHWSRTCRTPKHLVEAYQRMKKRNDEQQQNNETHHVSLPEANAVLKEYDDDFLKYELEDYGDQA